MGQWWRRARFQIRAHVRCLPDHQPRPHERYHDRSGERLTAVSEQPKIPRTPPPARRERSSWARQGNYRGIGSSKMAARRMTTRPHQCRYRDRPAAGSAAFNTQTAHKSNQHVAAGEPPSGVVWVVDNYLGTMARAQLLIYFPPGEKAVLLPWIRFPQPDCSERDGFAHGGGDVTSSSRIRCIADLYAHLSMC